MNENKAMQGTGETRGDEEAEQPRRRRAAALLMSSAAHDLRTPLNTMAGWLQVLQSAQDLPESTRERAFKGLQSAVAQQIALAEGLAQIAAIDSCQVILEPGPVDVEELLNAAVAAQEGEARAKGVELNVDAPDDGLQLRSDHALLSALLRHSLSGALKFAAKNSELRIDLAQAPEPDGACLVTACIARSLLPAAGIQALLRYAAGQESVKPNGAGAAFAFGVGQGIAGVLGATLEATVGESAEEVLMVLRIPALS